MRSGVFCLGAFLLTRLSQSFVAPSKPEVHSKLALRARGGGEYDISGSDGLKYLEIQVTSRVSQAMRTSRTSTTPC